MKRVPTVSAKKRIAPVTSKWGNARLLARHPSTSPFVPATRLLSLRGLKGMLARFPFVYLKPVYSCRGKGVIRIDHADGGAFRLRTRTHSRDLYCQDGKSLWEQLQKEIGRRPYIIQQGIQSVTSSGLPFDIRVHLVRIDGRWTHAGTVGKLSEEERIVTNRHCGGKPKPIEDLLKDNLNLNDSQSEQMIRTLEEVAIRATRIISRHHPKWWEFGVDLGIEPKGRIWIYEVNITPGGMVFKTTDTQAFQELLRLRQIARCQAERRR